MTTKYKTFLASEEGIRNANRFVKALAEGRILVTIPHITASGMSRIIRLREVAICEGCARVYQFDWFAEKLGFHYSDSWNGLSVSGCGMDMVFNTLYTICERLQECGFTLPEDWSGLCCNYLRA